MKSDREFLDGIYEKARSMNKDNQETEAKAKGVKNNVIFFKVGAAAAILVFICSAGVFMQQWRKEAVKNEQNTPNVTSFRMEIPGGIQQVIHDATDIIELEPLQGEGKAPVIHQIYKTSVKEEVLLSVLEKNAVSPDPERELLVFLKIGSNTSEILNVMQKDEKEDIYTSPFTGTITKEELETYIRNQAEE